MLEFIATAPQQQSHTQQTIQQLEQLLQVDLDSMPANDLSQLIALMNYRDSTGKGFNQETLLSFYNGLTGNFVDDEVC